MISENRQRDAQRTTSAIVIGGSLAGMCTARVLSDFVDSVTVIERDAYPVDADFRPGVPQARHVHNLLARGLREFDRFFPGFEQRMLQQGAVAAETGWDIATLRQHGWNHRSHTGLWQLFASRPLIESTVLKFCRGLHNVTFLERTEVTALRAAGESRRYCTGVEARSRADGRTINIDADLVVDASGAHSKSGELLKHLELNLPEDEIIDGHNSYSSRWFRLESERAWPSQWWWKVLYLGISTPQEPYIIAFFPIENQRWVLSYIGVNKAPPPSREDQFMNSLARLASPVVHEMVQRMEPISPVYPCSATRNRWRHYERWQKPLGNFIAIGDAVCSFNPRFGQGMSAAAVSARVLNDCLVKYGIGGPRLPERFFSEQARFQRTPWLFAAADDLRFSTTLGKRTVSTRLFNLYRRLMSACSNERLGTHLSEVNQFVRPMSSLFVPQVFSRILISAICRQTKLLGRRASSHGIGSMPPD
jgi:2-polyprenyl-6-methoxyphenol hydroxylase-like FAD-dependent oxidoreductase